MPRPVVRFGGRPSVRTVVNQADTRTSSCGIDFAAARRSVPIAGPVLAAALISSCLAAGLAAACSTRPEPGSPSPNADESAAAERTLQTDLLRLQRDQALYLRQHGTFAFTLRDLDFRTSDGVSITLRWVSARSYYAYARSGGRECLIGEWDVKSDLPVQVQTRLAAPGSISCGGR